MTNKKQTSHITLPSADIDDIFHYKLSPGRTIDDRCRIRIYRRPQKTICIITELPNSGMSVTNCIEKILPQIFWLFKQESQPLPENTIFIEHYNNQSYEGRDYPDSFDLVSIENNQPFWQSLSFSQLTKLLASPID